MLLRSWEEREEVVVRSKVAKRGDELGKENNGLGIEVASVWKDVSDFLHFSIV